MVDGTDAGAAALADAISGQYRLEREIGRGGMGIVYLALDLQLEREVAIKTLPPHLAGDAAVRDRFLREARTAGALSHQNIVPIYAAAERDGTVYFVMRYIAGESLADRLAKSGTLAPRDVVAILRQLASALAYAHTRGVVHRDIKAENVLLDADTGRAMLTDFGIARLAETKPLTATGTVLGTVQYMSPEQVVGETLDGRSDLYALGVLAFLMLCGKFPFERNSPSAVLVAHVNSPAPRTCETSRDVPAGLGDIVDRLLTKSRDARFATGDALRDALDALPPDGYDVAVRARDSAPLAMLTPQGTPVASASGAGTGVLSSAEAQEVWARAAELQANTGLHVPPAEFTQRAPGAELLTRGYNASLVKASAIDAGIDGKYVERALAERAQSAPVGVRPGPQMQGPRNPLIGKPTKIDYEASIDGELTDEGFEEIADEVRRQMGEMMTVSSVGRSLSITTSPMSTKGSSPRRLQISISSRNGRTTIRANEDLSQTALGAFMGLTLGAGIGPGMGLMAAVMGITHNGLMAGTTLVGTIGMCYGLARLVYSGMFRKRDAELRRVVEAVMARAREFVVQRHASIK